MRSVIGSAFIKPENIFYRKERINEGEIWNWITGAVNFYIGDYFRLDEKQTIREEYVFKIGDLGGACSPTNSILITGCKGFGTPLYTSPYITRHLWQPITIKKARQGDMWSLGVTYYVLLELIRIDEEYDEEYDNLFPFDVKKFEPVILQASKKRLSKHQLMQQKDIYVANFNLGANPAIMNTMNQVINGLLRVDDDKRLTADQALEILKMDIRK